MQTEPNQRKMAQEILWSGCREGKWKAAAGRGVWRWKRKRVNVRNSIMTTVAVTSESNQHVPAQNPAVRLSPIGQAFYRSNTSIILACTPPSTPNHTQHLSRTDLDSCTIVFASSCTASATRAMRAPNTSKP